MLRVVYLGTCSMRMLSIHLRQDRRGEESLSAVFSVDLIMHGFFVIGAARSCRKTCEGGGPGRQQQSAQCTHRDVWEQLDACPSATTLFAQDSNLLYACAKPFYPYRFSMLMPRQMMLDLVEPFLPHSK